MASGKRHKMVRDQNMSHKEGAQGLLKACAAQLTSLCNATKARRNNHVDGFFSPNSRSKTAQCPPTHVLDKGSTPEG
jgi:hypothetical protein